MNHTYSIVVSRTVVAMLAAFLLAAVFPETSSAQTDPSIGTWKLNLAKSIYNPGPAPKSVTFTTEVADQGLRSTFEGLDAAGMPVPRVVFVVTPDGQPHVVTGSPNFDSSTVKRVDPYIQVYTISKAGNVVTRGTIVLSPDGRTMIIHGIGVAGFTGVPQSDNVSVYEKQ